MNIFIARLICMSFALHSCMYAMTIDTSTSKKNSLKDNFTPAMAILFNRLPEELRDCIWDNLREWRLKKTLTGHTGSVTQLTYSPDGTQIASGSSDRTIKFWNLTIGACVQTIKGSRQNPNGHSRPIRILAYSPDGTQLASVSADNTTKLWDLKTNFCIQTIKGSPQNPNGHSGAIKTLAYSPEGTQLISVSYDNTTKLWDPKNGDCLQTIANQPPNPNGPCHPILGLVYSPDGTQRATGSYDRTIKLWERVPSLQEDAYKQPLQNCSPKDRSSSVKATV
ncbi:MAG: WD40 repeat domain-containing protein [Gammaproteobacteria bacterium]|nr:WD40 repeat domain-containing protein [Gammaproteobacteria bacterium]